MSIFNYSRVRSFSNPCLIFVGLGPGDPKLLTIAALDAIRHATLVAYPIANLEGTSIAREIAFNFIKHKKCLPLYFPMVKDSNVLRSAWEKASYQLIDAVEKGEQVVFLCQGDPSLYATSAYILHLVQSKYPSNSFKVIPGVSSINAAAAEAKLPLALQREELLVCPVPDIPQELEELIEFNVIHSKKVLVLMKLGKRWPWVREILSKKNLLSKTILAKRIGFPDQLIAKASNVDSQNVPYFSLLIIRNPLVL